MNFEQLGQQVGLLVASKNAAYGDSFAKAGEVLKLLYPNGIKPDQYRDALGILRVIDKLFRIANDKEAFEENPWEDIAGYGVLGMAEDINEGFWYMAIPYSHEDPAVMASRFNLANQVAMALLEQGQKVYSPISHTHPVSQHNNETMKNWDFWKQVDMPFMKAAKGLIVIMADGWDESIGVLDEIEEFQKMGKPIKYRTPEEILEGKP